jgi:hypothetical protein
VHVLGGETQSQFLKTEKEPEVDDKFYVTYKTGSSTFHEPITPFTHGVPSNKTVTIVVAPNGVRLERQGAAHK